jgi:soluble lytic murein transglycosylase-like protein
MESGMAGAKDLFVREEMRARATRGRALGVRVRRILAGLTAISALLAVAVDRPRAEATFELDEHPSLPPPLTSDAATPAVLSQLDATRYAKIFQLQRTGRWSAADAEIAHLTDRLLLGHVQLQRYMHPTAYRSSYDELTAWLRQYGDHPEAVRVYRLALRRKPKGAEAPTPPSEAVLPLGQNAVQRESGRAGEERSNPTLSAREAQVLRDVAEQVNKRQHEAGEQLLERRHREAPLSPAAYDEARARLAAGLFFGGDDERAFAMAAASAERSRAFVESADWIAGLSAWRLGRIGQARHHFEQLAYSKSASPWNATAGAYWAARCYQAQRRPALVAPMLALAAERPRTFYGLLAARWLDKDSPFDWQAPPLSRQELKALMKLPAIRRVVALAQAGRHDLADLELRGIYLSGRETLGPALVGLANRLRIPATQLRLAQSSRRSGGPIYDAALFPMPPWEPKDGFRVDRALVYALIRQESGFEVKAKSGAGARGLMQIMPATASFVANDQSLNGSGKDKLLKPEYNLEIGQRYLDHLLKSSSVRGNLVHLAVAYNSGPGTLSKWLKALPHNDDPLLFMESLPSRETRFFVERVLTNFWIYRQRLRQDTPSLDAIASGLWPYYLRQDKDLLEVAQTDGRN